MGIIQDPANDNLDTDQIKKNKTYIKFAPRYPISKSTQY